MTVYLVRHAIAEERTGQKPDAKRRLTAEGAERMLRAAKGLKRLGIAPDRVVSSPLTRALETAAILVETLAPGHEVERSTALEPMSDPREALSLLRPARADRSLMLVGHQPHLGLFASLLLTGEAGLAPLPFKKGGIAAVVIATGRGRTRGVLEWFLAPKQLRSIARGEDS